MRNPELYRKLKEVFGEVKIANEGEPLVLRKRQGLQGEILLFKDRGGEEYRVCCPMCGDQRFRLYINHAWGLDATLNFPVSRLVVCQNEHCEKNDTPSERHRGNAVEFLRSKLQPYFHELKSGVTDTKALVQEPEEEPYGAPLPFPVEEWCQPVSSMAIDHVAIRYLCDVRRFNPVELERFWHIRYSNQYPVEINGKDYRWLAGRVFIPTLEDEGWQARSLVDGARLKYFSCPGWKKARCVYNLQRARQYPLAVVVEGVTDVWRIGGPGVGIFGKDLSNYQLEKLAENFQAVAVMLDPDAFEFDLKHPNKVPSGQKTLAALASKIPIVFRVNIMQAKDPANCTHEMLWEWIEMAAARFNIRGTLRPKGEYDV